MGILNGVRGKPKCMHIRTYGRIKYEHEAHSDILSLQWLTALGCSAKTLATSNATSLATISGTDLIII